MAGKENGVDKILEDEKEMIKNNTWKEHLFGEIKCENLDGYDALCVSDASFDKEKGVGSFGVIVIPLKDGKMGDKKNVIVESAKLMDKDDKEFKRVLYKMNMTDGVEETIAIGRDVEKYVKSGEADRAESESAIRVVEICKANNWNRIVYVSDCQPLLQAIQKGESKAPANKRLIEKIKEWSPKMENEELRMELRKVGSHENAVIGELSEFGPNGDKINVKEFDRDKSRLYVLLNDLVDLMAKAELEAKGGSAGTLNKCSVHLVPNEDGTYPETGSKSDMNKIYDGNLTTYERRVITRKMIERIKPLIETAISNGNVK